MFHNGAVGCMPPLPMVVQRTKPLEETKKIKDRKQVKSASFLADHLRVGSASDMTPARDHELRIFSDFAGSVVAGPVPKALQQPWHSFGPLLAAWRPFSTHFAPFW